MRLSLIHIFSGLAESALWPQVNASLSSNRQRFSEHGLIPPPYAGTRQNVNELQFGGQWEIDFFGKNRAGLEAAIGELREMCIRDRLRVLIIEDSAELRTLLTGMLDEIPGVDLVGRCV